MKRLQYINLGIKGKLSLLLLLCTLIPFAVIGYYGYDSSSRALTANILPGDRQITSSLAESIERYYSNLPYDMTFMSNTYSLNRYLQWKSIGEPFKTQQWLRDARNSYYSIISPNPKYMQMQLIDLQGQEILRIDPYRSRYKGEIVAEGELKNRKDEPYFIKSMTLKQGELYFRDTHINPEAEAQGINIPAVSYSTPIIDGNGILQAILVLSVYADNYQEILERENTQKQNEQRYMLVNATGNYLFGNQKINNLKQDAPSLFEALQANEYGTVFSDGLIFTYKRIYPQKGSNNYWVLIKQTDQAIAMSEVQKFKFIFILMVLGATIIVLFLSHWVTRGILSPLLAANAQLKSLAQGSVPTEALVYDSHDEVAEIIQSVQQVKNSISNTIRQSNTIAEGDYSNDIVLLSEQDQLGRSLTNMTHRLRAATENNKLQNWLKDGQTTLNEHMSGEQNITTLAENVIRFLASYLKAQVGAFYLMEQVRLQETSRLKLIASYAFMKRKGLANEFEVGEGIIGQAALEKQMILITEVPADYICVHSGLGEAVPQNILVVPFLYEGDVRGVIELGSFAAFDEICFEFMEQISNSIAIAVNTAQSRTQMQELLQQTQTQTEELQSQAEELQSQQEELRQTNEELEERTRDLEQQKEEIREKNTYLEKAQQAIEKKAREVEIASKYKSEFLANMSHELRTPLNSLLILAQLLTDNKENNLTSRQIEYARTIHSAGADLLALINDILDLSKVEAGKLEVHPEEYNIKEIVEVIQQKFNHIAEQKHLKFQVSLGERLPDFIYTDSQRLKQILNNLLSNAFKFTAQGEVALEIRRPARSEVAWLKLDADQSIAIAVRDTGIGVPKDKQGLIFEAFQQVDGTTSRKYGGTGLGLSISRQLSRLLGGEIMLFSEEGKGCTFIFYLPDTYSAALSQEALKRSEMPSMRTVNITGNDHVPPPPQFLTPPSTSSRVELPQAFVSTHEETHPQEIAPATPVTSETEPAPASSIPQENNEVPDDREDLELDDRSLLIVEDDRNFARILMDLAHEKQFKCLLAEDGRIGLQLAECYKPTAIILDVGLPKVDGWTVMEKLKSNPDTRHIPVHFVSGSDQGMDAKRMGAIGFLLKPVSMAELSDAFKKIEQFASKALKKLLILSDSVSREKQLLELVRDMNVESTTVETRDAALQYLQQQNVDCLIVDADVEQRQGTLFLEKLYADDSLSQVPVILYTDRELSREEEAIASHCADNVTIKSVRSPERLLDEATLFLHQLEANLPKEKRSMLRMVHDKEAILTGKKVLVVDDDMRNTFALATVLEEKNMEVLIAKNGREALTSLENNKDVSIILMDIMMPEMDGYEAMHHIRAQERFRKLPIIALTAKAMKGDKAKCIEAGANDYLAKPVDMDKLVSLMRVWLYR